jgi:hypothetical protein
MVKSRRHLMALGFIPLLAYFSAFGADNGMNKKNARPVFRMESYSFNRDIAFISMWGGRPDVKDLKGFRRAVLYNARGEVVRKMTMGRDSIYSLDKMLQEQKALGPLFVRMYRR